LKYHVWVIETRHLAAVRRGCIQQAIELNRRFAPLPGPDVQCNILMIAHYLARMNASLAAAYCPSEGVGRPGAPGEQAIELPIRDVLRSNPTSASRAG
jgi:hypothetical protein